MVHPILNLGKGPAGGAPRARHAGLLAGCLALLALFGALAASFRSRIWAQTPVTKSQSVRSQTLYYPRFEDVGRRAGLTAETVIGGVETKKYFLETVGGGVALLDYDGDGWLDIFLVNGSRLEGFAAGQEPTNYLYRNRRDGTFADVTEAAGLVHSGWGQGACVGDYDNDSRPDLFVTYYGKNLLYRNQGGGTFRDFTQAANLLQPSAHFNAGCTFLDYDRDGFLDLFVANSVTYEDAARVPPDCNYKGVKVNCGPLGLRGSKNLLYHNRGDGTFEDVSEKSGVHNTGAYYSWTPCAFDYDDDGWPDIYVTNDSTPSYLYHNQRDGTFAEVGHDAGVAYTLDGFAQGSMGVTVGDFNGDGRLDLFRTNFIDDTPTLFENLGSGFFQDVTFATGVGVNTRFLGWGTAFLDFDNDGWPDLLYVTGHVYPEIMREKLDDRFETRKVLYRNLGDRKFQDISLQSGPGILLARSSRGAAVGDIFNTGQLDVVINNMNAAPTLLRNVAPSPHHWIVVNLIGRKTNRAAIGSRVRLSAGPLRQVQEVLSGCGFCSQNDLRLHFGLGKAEEVDRVEVQWLGGAVETYQHLPANRFVTIVEGRGVESVKEFANRP
ncbi:MAG: CRTAC1 family protein [Terriglobia bacterium]